LANLHTEREPAFAWPAGFEPRSARLYFRNARTIAAPAEQIWSWLVAAPLWPSWFPNASNVSLVDGASQLEMGTRFRWTQSGIALDSVVREFVPNRRLAWFATSRLVRAYHAWDLSPEGGAVHVITDESQHGIMPAMLGPLLKPRMLAIHDLWLARLDLQATTNLRPS
jgi:uncharacterized protein YndB with AHSA1/START domain